MKHTPGPWSHSPRRASIPDSYMIFDSDKGIIATVNAYTDKSGYGDSEMDAKLISTSPELLSACKSAIALITGGSKYPDFHCNESDALAKLKNAVKKATK